MAKGFEFFPQRGADLFDHVEARKPARQMDADAKHDKRGKDLQDKVGIAWADDFHDGLAKATGDGAGQGIADQAAKIENGGIAEQAQGRIANLFGQAHGQGADDAPTHTQAVDGAEQANNKGVKYTQAQITSSEKYFAQCTGKSDE